MLALAGCGASEPAAPAAQSKEATSPQSEEVTPDTVQHGKVAGWLGWRGPTQMGVSEEAIKWEKGMAPLWTYDISGGGTPIVADDKVYLFGYYGEEADLQEALVALNADTGEKLWEYRFNDFISDIIYNRYAIGAPAVDAATGNVYLQTTAGLLMGFTPDGKKLWERSMMEEFGRLTFPNGRTGAPVVFENLVIVHGITANWGTNGPARDRFYAFDKKTGELVWFSTPGVGPIDSSFSTPILGTLGERAVFYAGTGCGNVVCVDARTGQPLWRMKIASGGVNSSLILYNGPLPQDAASDSYNPKTDTDADNTVASLIIIHGKENLDSTLLGRMIRIKLPTAEEIAAAKELPLVLGKDVEIWRNDDMMRAFTSSPILAGDRVYTTVATGEFVATDAVTGENVWKLKLGNDQLHASPAYAKGSGLFFVPMHESKLFVIKDENTKGEIVDEVELDGVALGAPAFWNGRVFLETKKKVYAWGPKEPVKPAAKVMSYASFNPGEKETQVFATEGKAVSARIVPPEFILPQGETQGFQVQLLDSQGIVLEDNATVESWEKWIPPQAKVRAMLDADFEPNKNAMAAGKEAAQSAGAIKATTTDDLTATARGRVLIEPPYEETFEEYELTATSPETSVHGAEKFAFPPLPWTGARVKFRVIDLEGNKVLGNVLDVLLFQRARSFIGPPDLSNYTLSADVRTDGNRRISSEAGLINQRYQIGLVGNTDKLEVSSNYDRLWEQVDFPVKPNTWYTLKTNVVTNENGSGVVRAKAWERDAEEPSAWTIEVPIDNVNRHGAPGFYSFSPQSKKRVYFDNIKLEKSGE